LYAKAPKTAAHRRSHVILSLAANPRDTGRLALDHEARAIHVELNQPLPSLSLRR
jgi:hypothetical protein